MPAPSLWLPLLRPVLWFTRRERQRRRGLRTLAQLQSRGIATRSDIAIIDERALVATQRLVEHRRSFEQAHEAVQQSQAELQSLLDRMSAVGVTRTVKL